MSVTTFEALAPAFPPAAAPPPPAVGVRSAEPVVPPQGSPAAPTEGQVRPEVFAPTRPVDLAFGVAGWLALGLVGLSTAEGSTMTGAALTLAAPAGAMLLTVPALLVGHQYLALQAAPATLVTALLRGFTGSGRVALGLVPLLLGFAATTDIAPGLAVAALLGVSLHALLLTMGRLERLEAAAHPGGWSARGRMGLLVLGWGALYGLIGLRLAWNVAIFAAGSF